MRAALALVLLAGCSLITETSDLASGTRATPTTDTGVVTPDADTCNPDDCISDIAVVKLAEIAPCSAAGATDNLACRQRVAAACKALNPCCYKGGYGPVDFPNPAEATVYCLTEASYTAPFAELTTANPKCLASAAASRECDRAAHVSSIKRGNGTAILQSATTDTATLIALESGVPTEEKTTWGELTKLEPGCTFATLESQACTIAAHRFCVALPDSDYLFGYGPILWTSTDVTIACVF
jgi:hypothetical protein